MSEAIVVIGAGGHAAVIADALLACAVHVLGYTDADASRSPLGPCGLPVLGTDAFLGGRDPSTLRLANGIGGVGRAGQLDRRRELQQALEAAGWRFVSVRHPSATVSRHARVDAAVQLLAGSIVQAGAYVGTGCIVNTSAVVEHDVEVGAWTHVAPRALLCGGVSLGAGCHIGAGAVLREGVKLAAGTVVGAGALVLSDALDGGTLVGVPARRLESLA